MIDNETLKAHGYNLTTEQKDRLNEHYHNPKNRWALKEYNARGIGRNPNNYGQVDMYLLIDDKMTIENIGYEFKGCPTIGFAASIFTEDVKGISLEEGQKTTQSSLDEMLKQDNCEECTTMILVAFLASYENYQKRQNGSDEEYTVKMIETNLEFTQTTCG
ncbi:iron-sulfur cluster assembly scaffold protein [bacterium]|nr:iron-sulfur cluster assembly scaffold protein [bacterium]MBU1957630.1 iron-sulfur cluster assembly scaffold protein [bacterium]